MQINCGLVQISNKLNVSKIQQKVCTAKYQSEKTNSIKSVT